MNPRLDRGVEPRELADWLLAQGRNFITTTEASVLLGIPERRVAPTLARWRRRGHLFSPTRGLDVAVPPEFRSWGAVPAPYFVDALMGHLGHDYYVGLLSAAEVHGFAHQRPQGFQVITLARLRDRTFGRVRIGFITDASTSARVIEVVNTPTGTMRVSAIETTVLDLVAHQLVNGGISNVATIIGEMLEEDRIDTSRLAGAGATFPASVVQRTGRLLDFMSARVNLELDVGPLLAMMPGRRSVLLAPGGDREGERDPRWRVIVNARPAPDS